MTNICNELKCPHSLTSGCDRFSVSGHCPLARIPGVWDNQYWIFDRIGGLNIEDLRQELKSQVLDTETSKRMLETESNVFEKPLKRSWE